MEPGTRVFDTEDDDPDPAIVVRVPDDKTIADWTYEKDGEDVSTADENLDYPEDTQLVNVTFEEYLKQRWPEWTDAAPATLWTKVQDREIPVYGFPESRLGYVEPPATLESAIAQLAESVDAVEWRPAEQHLHIETLGETFTIAPDGTVSGEGRYADRLEEIVADPTDESTYKYQP